MDRVYALSPDDESGEARARATDCSLDLFLRPIRSRNLFEETVGRLAQTIQLGMIAPGDRFPPERELAEMLKISRVTVREALRALEQAGLIQIRRGRQGGAYVVEQRRRARSEPGAKRIVRQLGQSLNDLLEYRRAIEPAAAALAAEKADSANIDQLRQMLEASRSATPEGFRTADARIHLVIADTARSGMIANSVADIQARLTEVFMAIPILDESIRHSHDQHQAVADAIAAGDSGLARDAMEEHVLASEELIRGLS